MGLKVISVDLIIHTFSLALLVVITVPEMQAADEFKADPLKRTPTNQSCTSGN